MASAFLLYIYVYIYNIIVPIPLIPLHYSTLHFNPTTATAALATIHHYLYLHTHIATKKKKHESPFFSLFLCILLFSFLLCFVIFCVSPISFPYFFSLECILPKENLVQIAGKAGGAVLVIWSGLIWWLFSFFLSFPFFVCLSLHNSRVRLAHVFIILFHYFILLFLLPFNFNVLRRVRSSHNERTEGKNQNENNGAGGAWVDSGT